MVRMHGAEACGWGQVWGSRWRLGPGIGLAWKSAEQWWHHGPSCMPCPKQKHEDTLPPACPSCPGHTRTPADLRQEGSPRCGRLDGVGHHQGPLEVDERACGCAMRECKCTSDHAGMLKPMRVRHASMSRRPGLGRRLLHVAGPRAPQALGCSREPMTHDPCMQPPNRPWASPMGVHDHEADSALESCEPPYPCPHRAHLPADTTQPLLHSPTAYVAMR